MGIMVYSLLWVKQDCTERKGIAYSDVRGAAMLTVMMASAVDRHGDGDDACHVAVMTAGTVLKRMFAIITIGYYIVTLERT